MNASQLMLGIGAVAALIGTGSPARAADAPSASAPAGLALPTVPTTKILAVGHMTAQASAAALGRTLDSEVRATVELYLAGKVDQWYSRKDQRGVVFVLNFQDVQQAREALERLPLGQAGLMEFDLIPLGPLAPLGLISRKPAEGPASR